MYSHELDIRTKICEWSSHGHVDCVLHRVNMYKVLPVRPSMISSLLKNYDLSHWHSEQSSCTVLFQTHRKGSFIQVASWMNEWVWCFIFAMLRMEPTSSIYIKKESHNGAPSGPSSGFLVSVVLCRWILMCALWYHMHLFNFCCITIIPVYSHVLIMLHLCIFSALLLSLSELCLHFLTLWEWLLWPCADDENEQGRGLASV